MSPCTPTVLQCTTRRTPARAACSMRSPTATALTARYVSVGQAGLSIDGGDVVDDLDALHGPADRRRVAQIAGHDCSMAGSTRVRTSPSGSRADAARRSRTRARTWWPAAASVRARWPPVNPVAPVTSTTTVRRRP